MIQRLRNLVAFSGLTVIFTTMAVVGVQAQNAPPSSPEGPPQEILDAINGFAANLARGPDLNELGPGQITNNESGICLPTVFVVEDGEVVGEPHLLAGDAFLLLGPINDGNYLLIPSQSNSSDWGVGPYTMYPSLFPNVFDVSPNVEVNPHAHEPDRRHRIKVHIERFENPGNCPSYLRIWNFGAPGNPNPDDPGHGGARGY